MGKPGVNFPGEVVGNEFRLFCIPEDRTDVDCPVRQSCLQERKKKEGIAEIMGDISSRARQLHGHVPAHTRSSRARFQALWLWASRLTPGISVPLAGKEANCSSGISGFSWAVRTLGGEDGVCTTAQPQQTAIGRVRWTLFFVPCLQVQACFLQGQVQEASFE